MAHSLQKIIIMTVITTVEESWKLKIVVGVNEQKMNKQIQLNINSIKKI